MGVRKIKEYSTLAVTPARSVRILSQEFLTDGNGESVKRKNAPPNRIEATDFSHKDWRFPRLKLETLLPGTTRMELVKTEGRVKRMSFLQWEGIERAIGEEGKDGLLSAIKNLVWGEYRQYFLINRADLDPIVAYSDKGGKTICAYSYQLKRADGLATRLLEEGVIVLSLASKANAHAARIADRMSRKGMPNVWLAKK